MTKTQKINVKCPYCGNVNEIYASEHAECRPYIVLCDVEESPGCDSYFGVEVEFEPVVTVYKMEEAKEC